MCMHTIFRYNAEIKKTDWLNEDSVLFLYVMPRKWFHSSKTAMLCHSFWNTTITLWLNVKQHNFSVHCYPVCIYLEKEKYKFNKTYIRFCEILVLSERYNYACMYEYSL